MNAIELIEKYRCDVLAKMPYRMNLIELLHANENAHTRILVELLRYNHSDSNFRFAKNFLRKFVRELDDLGVPDVREQEDYIDAIIGEKGKYAVVVENKINWATDRTGQAERYLMSAKELFSVEDGQLYFIYLTDNGKKEISDFSLTQRVSEMLGIGDNEGESRYIKLNYRDHVLPWIKNDVLPCCLFGEVQTISALQQYADYLESRLVNNIRRDPNEELFLESCCPYKLSAGERYNLFSNLRNSLDSALPEDSGVDMEYARDELRALIERKMETLHDADFSLNASYAVSKMVSRIRDWGYEIDYCGPHIYRRTDVIVSQVELKDGSRMKFEINVDNDLRLNSAFFDNNWKVPLNKGYPRLVNLFKEIFGEVTEDGMYHISSFSEEIKNVPMLEDFLRTKATPFMLQFKDMIVK